MDRVRWGLLGCGDVAHKRVARAIIDDPNSELVAACRRNESELKKFCKKFNVPRAFRIADELCTFDEIDALYIATPVYAHVHQTIVGARHGKHVLVEKPMGMSTEDCSMMIAVCEEESVKLGVAYYRRFYPMVHRICELTHDGTIGTPLAVSAVTATPLTSASKEEGNWRIDLDESGGGPLMDVGSHRINLFLHLFGRVRTVSAICANAASEYEVEDSALLLLEFQCGVTATLQCHFGCADPDEFVVTGTKGRLIARPLNGDTLVIEKGTLRTSEHLAPPANFCGPLIEDFTTAIVKNQNPLVGGNEGIQTNRIIERAYSAARSLR